MDETQNTTIGSKSALIDGLNPPLLGNWRHANGVLCCGTLRIAIEDFDTNPSEAFKSELLDWVCQTLNNARRV